MEKIIVTCKKEGPILKFKNQQKYLTTDMEFDLRDRTHCFTRIRHYKTRPDKIDTISGEHARYYFIKAKLECEDPKFDKVLKLSQHNVRSNFSNLARFIEYLGWSRESKRYDEWLSIDNVTISDIEEWYQENKDKHPAHEYIPPSPNIGYSPGEIKKEALNKIKELKNVTSRDISKWVRYYNIEHRDILEKLIEKNENPKYNGIFGVRRYDNSYFNVLKENSMYRRSLLEMIDRYNLDIDTFCEYLHKLHHRENIDISLLIEKYQDYLRMGLLLVGNKLPKLDKYPDNILTMHQKILKEYNAYKQYYDKQAFRYNSYDRYKDLEWNNRNYCIIVPKDPKEIEHEADEMHHCVRSYIKDVTDGKTLIVFLRDKETPDQPLVTIEVKQKHITQAYAQYDKKPSEEQLDAIAQWAKKKNIVIHWCWEEHKK